MKNHKELPPYDELKYKFDYDEDTGILYWKNSRFSTLTGTPVGTIEDGYLRVRLYNKHFRVHRIIWKWYYGDLPTHLTIDHIDHNRLNNRIKNLRLATHAQQQQNRLPSSRCKSGHIGVRQYGIRWRAEIQSCGIKYQLGYFDTIEEAIVARKNGELKYFDQQWLRNSNEES